MKSMFIVFDGMDGSGKGEMLKRLHNHLFDKDKSIRILSTREPTYGKYGKKIRELLASDDDPMKNAEKCLELYVKDRKEHVKLIEDFLKKDDGNVHIVLCDRYYYSTIAFQTTQGIEMDRAIDMNKGFLKPDIAFILDLEPEISMERINKSRDKKEKFEDIDFMKQLRGNFLFMEKKLKDNLVYINAGLSKDKVFEQIKNEVDKLM